MKYICQICGYVYDDDKEKIPFEELSDDWVCPLCGARKSDFKKEEPKEKINNDYAEQSDLIKLNYTEMGALFSNLSRGSEKQYKDEEAKLFKELADYFDKISPKYEVNRLEDLLDLINHDIDEYPSLKEYSLSNGDRGAARVAVWGEKVSRMISSLLKRYISEGEKMLENTNIYVCTVCGFIYVGDNPPELCPVCKVPSWKFEKVEGKAQ